MLYRELMGTKNILVVEKDIIRKLGLEEAVLLCYLSNQDKKISEHFDINPDPNYVGYFYKTTKMIKDNTGLSYAQQNRIIKKLVSLGYLNVKHGDRYMRFFKINDDSLSEFFPQKEESKKEQPLIFPRRRV